MSLINCKTAFELNTDQKTLLTTERASWGYPCLWKAHYASEHGNAMSPKRQEIRCAEGPRCFGQAWQTSLSKELGDI